MLPVEAMREIAFTRPSVGMSMWYETLVEGRSSANGCSTLGVATPEPDCTISYVSSLSAIGSCRVGQAQPATHSRSLRISCRCGGPDLSPRQSYS
jgi:hypothetical protein